MVRIPAFIHALTGGMFLAVAVDLAGVEAKGDSPEAALERLERVAASRLRSCSPAFKASLSSSREPVVELVPVRVVIAESASDPVTVNVGLVSWSHSASTGELRYLCAPMVRGWELAVSPESDVRARAAEALASFLSSWDLTTILLADETEVPSLAWINVIETPESRKADGNGPLNLDDLGDELTRLAAAGHLGRLDRRDPIVDRVLSSLATPGMSSVLLVGPPDVGKSALVGEVAARMHAGDVPPALRGRTMWRLSANELIAGARYTGMWQERARMLVERARSEKTVFAMGDPVGIIDAGRWSESSNNLSRVLRPAMETGELTLICECTPETLETVAKKEPSFVTAFHRVDLHEPPRDEAARIVAAAARRFESSHGVELDDSAIAAAMELTSRFEPYRALPGKAVRLLSEVVHRSTATDGQALLEREEVIAAFSERTGLPRSILSDDVLLDLADASVFLERRVLGQPEAVRAMVDLLAVIKAGLQDPTKPLGSFFFVGPTGVGKTELAKATAELLFGHRDRMVRFDMGEYGSGDAVAKLIGSGWREEAEGELTRRVREQPFSVVLLDEIEKAHPDVFDALLSLLGEGHLTDAAGRTADFRNTIVIMTSNLGADKSEDQSIGFSPVAPGSLDARRRHFVDRAERFFRPEFFNRIDRIVVFSPLEKEVIRRIARREIGRLVLREGVTRRRLLVEIDDAVVERCAELGFHAKYGARPLQREIERAISQPLARIVVAQSVQPGDLISFRLKDGAITPELTRLAAALEGTGQEKKRSTLRAEASLGRVLEEVLALVERVEGQNEEPGFLAVVRETDRLLASTHEPGFWDEPGAARETLARYYELNGCIERLKSTTRRVQGLAQLVRQMVAHRDRSRLAEVREALDEIEDAADLHRLEMAGAASGSLDSVALVLVNGVGPGTDNWAEELVKMYEHWANRTGRQVARLQGRLGLRIEGLSTYQLLAGESGLHRQVADHGSSLLARVMVLRDDEAPGTSDNARIVRQYHQGRRQFVKDPRTGVRTTNVRAVLDEGRLDIFLLESARAEGLARHVS